MSFTLLQIQRSILLIQMGLATNPVNFGRSDLGSAGGQSFISEAAVIPNQKLMRCYLPGLVG